MCLGLIHDLGHGDRVVFRQTRRGLYYANKFYRLSSPLDVLRFGVLTPLDRLRLGWLAVRVKGVREWRALEQVTAKDWLISLAGRDVYRVVWEPLLNGKFGRYADTISAVWFWNKIALRGGSHGNGGKETLAYYRGGFGSLIEDLAQAIGDLGGTILTGEGVTGVSVADGRVVSVETTSRRSIAARAVLATPALPLIADMFKPHLSAAADARLRRIDYLANVCLVLELDRSLSDTYWLNVNDPSFPFVGIIEHTNFEPTSSYNGRHIAYLSKYRKHPAEAAGVRGSGGGSGGGLCGLPVPRQEVSDLLGRVVSDTCQHVGEPGARRGRRRRSTCRFRSACRCSRRDGRPSLSRRRSSFCGQRRCHGSRVRRRCCSCRCGRRPGSA